jgi:MerR family transcriptional regulator/heat shock protein HspR
MPPPTIISREQVARRLAVSPAVLARYESFGLIRAVRAEGAEGYEPAELHRVWTVLSLHRDAGINLAGIDAILRLRTQLDAAHAEMSRLVRELQALIEADLEELHEPPAEATTRPQIDGGFGP